MLGKLLKYELKSTSRIFGLCYGALLVLSVFSGLMFRFFDNGDGRLADFLESVTAISSMLYVFLIGAICLLTFVLVLQRFYKNLLQQEGYLMHTLPVSMASHIGSKILAALLWTIVSAVVIALSLGIFAIAMERFFDWSEFLAYLPDMVSMTLHALGRVYECPSGAAVLLLVLSVVTGCAAFYLFCYLCLAIGHLASKRKLLCSFGAYLGLSVVLEVVGAGLLNLLDTVQFPDLAVYESSLLVTAFTVLFGAVCFLITNVLMTKKLNLE
jgi:hypothetical protein